MDLPKVSVIIPVYNSSAYLSEAVYSVLPLSEVGELLLVEDGSTDGSYELCIELSKIDPRIKILNHPEKKNRGASESRNLGIFNSSCPYLAFLDSDDKYFGNRFIDSLNILETQPDVHGVYGKIIIKDLIQKFEKVYGVPQGIHSNELFPYLLNGGYFHTNTITVRKSFFEKVGFFNQKCWPHEDVEMWIRMANAGNLVQVSSDIPLAEYVIHGQNLSQVGNWKSKSALWKSVFAKYFFTSISFSDRLKILRQLSKVKVSQLKTIALGE